MSKVLPHYELMGRIHVLLSTIDSHLIGHEAATNGVDVLLEEAATLLAEACKQTAKNYRTALEQSER